MHFIIIARDGTDAEAANRRQNAREAHLKNIADNRHHVLMGVATLDEQGQMNGSVLVVDFSDREALDRWLAEEPYVVQQVWKEIEIVPGKVGPAFLKQLD
ncbi:MAG: YciI family protein [bacterium]|nr:YciI family protein [bacterium]